MASATASAPSKRLNIQDLHALKGVYSNVVELEAGTRTAEGRALIQDFLLPAVARDVIEFWEDEWLAAV
jgi:hypothetical protein